MVCWASGFYLGILPLLLSYLLLVVVVDCDAAVSRESSMFSDLIRAKQHLVLPVDMGQDTLKQVTLAIRHIARLPQHMLYMWTVSRRT